MFNITSILGFRLIYGDIREIIEFLFRADKICLYSANGEVLNNIIFNNLPLVENYYLIPDGITTLYLAKNLNGLHINKIPGIEVMQYILNKMKDKPLYLFGAKEEVNNKLTEKLIKQGVNIVGNRCGFGYDEQELIDAINKSGAEILFVALGSPLQEEFIYRTFNKLNVRLIVPVGGAFDVLSGYKKRAPKVFIKLKLEWLWRTLLEPKRAKKIYSIIKFNIYMLDLSLKLKQSRLNYATQEEEI
ncbi:MAG: WecB/TagA/CpsF family glycosyltransferase [Caloramator sp.]|nr:WecB/TagA/CpsF family glycosyltransferase [Caloramator sp.]